MVPACGLETPLSKRQIVPTSQEKVMEPGEIIVSKTDLKGRITYGNSTFLKYAGFPETDLIGTQHNIVRHPDMPRGVFKLFWDTLHQGQEIFAYVKNISLDGSYYWVLANVTPSMDAHGQTLGYYSVRRKPNPKATAVIAGLYREMLDAEHRAGSRDAVEASTLVLNQFLKSKGQTYEQAVLSLQSL
jgi:PAS domain S-box-containing protein